MSEDGSSVMVSTVSSEDLLDQLCADATELARQMAEEVAEQADHVGSTIGVAPAGPLSAVHRFACMHPGYVGWAWAVVVSRVDGSDVVSVDEAWLEPGEGALLAPVWRPWSERVQPGDLGVGDVFPTAADDARLTAGFTAEDDLDSVVADQPLHPLQWQLGLGRERVLSAVGREDAAERWLAGDGGPDAPVAKAATEQCVTCGWLMPIGGPLGQAFGVCAQPMSPSDGRVVSLLHGCGAHSEVIAEASALPVVDVVLDETVVFAIDSGDDQASEEPEPSDESEMSDASEAGGPDEEAVEVAEVAGDVGDVEVVDVETVETEGAELSAETAESEPAATEPAESDEADEA